MLSKVQLAHLAARLPQGGDRDPRQHREVAVVGRALSVETKTRMMWAARAFSRALPSQAQHHIHLAFGALFSLSLVAIDNGNPLTDALWHMNRNARKAKKANHGARPVSHKRRKAKAHRKGMPTLSRREAKR
jgi:hypothetical protein